MSDKVFARLDATARDKAFISTQWVNKHTGASARITKVFRITGAANPVAELTYDEPQSGMDNPARWDNDHLLRHWTPVYEEE